MSTRHTLVAVQDDRIIAFAELEEDGHLDMFYVHKDAVGKGIGARLYKAIEQRARERDVTQIHTEASITARPFFERQGFVVVSEQIVERGGVEMTNFAMDKPVQQTPERMKPSVQSSSSGEEPGLRQPESICVFCGSGTGNDPAYVEAAEALGRLLAERGITLVYGGGHVGLMGVIADAALAAGGAVIGVMPKALVEREIGHRGLTKLHVVGSMHERKALMSDLSEGFIALPGGNGTLEEFFEVLTWAQLGEHEKPCGLLNAAGFYNPLLAVFDHMTKHGFVSEKHRELVLVEESPEPLLRAFEDYRPPGNPKWIDRGQV